MEETLIEKVHRIFAEDHFAVEAVGITIEHAELSPNGIGGKAQCGLSLTQKHTNAKGAVMGGAIFTLADYTFAIASNLQGITSGDVLHWVSLHSSIHYLASCHGHKLIATALCVKQGKNTCLYDIEIHDDTGTLVAKVETCGMRV